MEAIENTKEYRGYDVFLAGSELIQVTGDAYGVSRLTPQCDTPQPLWDS